MLITSPGDDNIILLRRNVMKEKSFISQGIVYDTIQSYDGKLANQKYKSELENIRVAKKEDNVNLKKKLKQEIQNVKRQKLNVCDVINALRKSVNCETLASDQEQNLTRISNAAFIRMISEKKRKH